MTAQARPSGQWPRSRYLVWLLLAVPGCYWLQGYWRETHFYGEVVHATGVLATQLLIAALAITPMQRMLPRWRWLLWLRRQRRYVGVAAFAYAALHAGVYFTRLRDLDRILNELREPAMWTGWLALLVMLLLAATSNDSSLRWLGRRWQLLHRLVYVAAALTLLHWVWSAFDPQTAYVYGAVLIALEMARLFSQVIRKPSAVRRR